LTSATSMQLERISNMTNIVELSTGHVFAAGSIKAIGPCYSYTGWRGSEGGFVVHGVGFKVDIVFSEPLTIAEPTNHDELEAFKAYTEVFDKKVKAVHQEAVDKLIGP
jgi:hypothetical protein